MAKNKFIEKKSEEVYPTGEPIEVASEIKENIEKEEKLTSEEIQELRGKIEEADLDDDLKTQVQSHANDLNTLEEESKLKKLLEIANIKGVIFAVNVAKKMNDPYILDLLHDKLVEGGYYKSFLK